MSGAACNIEKSTSGAKANGCFPCHKNLSTSQKPHVTCVCFGCFLSATQWHLAGWECGITWSTTTTKARDHRAKFAAAFARGLRTSLQTTNFVLYPALTHKLHSQVMHAPTKGNQSMHFCERCKWHYRRSTRESPWYKKRLQRSDKRQKGHHSGVKAKAKGETLGPMPVSPQKGPHTKPPFSQATKTTCCTKRAAKLK